MYEYGYGYAHSGLGLIGGIFSIIFWVLIIALIIAIIRRVSMHDHGHHMWRGLGRSGLTILEERYAKGEISKQEFEEKKKDLMS